jgi:hypothetical protein
MDSGDNRSKIFYNYFDPKKTYSCILTTEPTGNEITLGLYTPINDIVSLRIDTSYYDIKKMKKIDNIQRRTWLDNLILFHEMKHVQFTKTSTYWLTIILNNLN